MSEGDCFMVAGKAVLEDHSLELVHGRVWANGEGTAPEGYHWHAWVERTDRVTFPHLGDRLVESTVCIDRSNGHDLTLPQALYYKVGGVQGVRRYSASGAHMMIERTGHWGPWDHCAGLCGVSGRAHEPR